MALHPDKQDNGASKHSHCLFLHITIITVIIITIIDVIVSVTISVTVINIPIGITTTVISAIENITGYNFSVK